MMISPKDVQKKIDARFNMTEICDKIDAQLLEHTTVGGKVYIPWAPDTVVSKVMAMYGRVGWVVSVQSSSRGDNYKQDAEVVLMFEESADTTGMMRR